MLSAHPHGASFWTRTAVIKIETEQGQEQLYFLKIATGEVGLGMARGEYHGIAALQKFIPEGVPHPVGWGSYCADADMHFYLANFVDMINFETQSPDMPRLCATLAKLHRSSMDSADALAKFGFHVLTYEGTMYQDVSWCNTWEEFYRLQLQAFFDQEKAARGPSKELDELLPALLGKVVPRLLRPLQSHGRVLKPALTHGDIWYGNLSTNAKTGAPLIFDPSVFWGHNECGFFITFLVPAFSF